MNFWKIFGLWEFRTGWYTSGSKWNLHKKIIQKFTLQHVIELIESSPTVQVFWNFNYLLGFLHSNMLCDLEILAWGTQVFRNEWYRNKIWLNYWHLLGLRKFLLRNTDSLKWIFPWIFSMKLVNFYYVMGLRKFYQMYTHGLV